MIFREHQKAYEILNDLLAIYSPYFNEGEISNYIYSYMSNIGASPIKQAVIENENYNYRGNNIISMLNFNKKETLVINAHMDTVYLTEGWDYAPLQGTLLDNEVYGLGSADMKGGLTSLLLTLEECLNRIKRNIEPAYNIIFLASVDEEGPCSLGAKTFIRSEYASDIDFAIVLESSKGLGKNKLSFPTLIYGSKGCYLYEIKVTGKSTHAADPNSGLNAINIMCKIVDNIMNVPLEKHKCFDNPISNVIWINGGERALSTPEKCSILVDFHVTPSENEKQLKRKIIEKISSLNLEADVEVDYMKDDLGEPMVYKPYLLNKENKHIALLEGMCKKTEGTVKFDTSICVGDFNHYVEKGISTVVLGPDGENLHSGNEKVNIDNIVRLKNILVNYIFLTN